MKERLDIVLVKKELFDSREKAKFAIVNGNVKVNDIFIDKPGKLIDESDEILLSSSILKYVSLGGLKLEKVIQLFNLNFNEKFVLDIGASTGGFTDCALLHGASFVYAIDVGSNQLAARLAAHPRIKSIENKHIKDLALSDINNCKVDVIVVDVSFISLTAIFPFFSSFLNENGILITLIKPQFEMDKKKHFRNGIIKDTRIHKNVIEKIIESAKTNYFHICHLTFAPIIDKSKNVEYLAVFSKQNIVERINIDSVIAEVKNVEKS
jgi:23S rRNA (cytidine1920-2'-O)/16S rRNA (cytidine1409-2'-O)-methyltransferase